MEFVTTLHIGEVIYNM